MPRRTDEIEMPMAEGNTLLCPETALLKWEGVRRRIDIGQLCYLRRESSSRSRVHQSVEEDSLDADRVRAIRKMVVCLSEAQRLAGLRPATVLVKARTLSQFVNWADTAELPGLLSDVDKTEKAVKKYFDYLRERVSQSKLNKNGAANQQRELLAVLSEFFKVDTFGVGLARMRGSKKHTQHTEVPDEQRQALLVYWSNILFEAITSRVLNFEPYPFAVTGVINPGGPPEQIWLLPTPSIRKADRKNTNRAWNIQTGELRTYDELRDQLQDEGIKYFRQAADTARRGASNRLFEANENRFARIRLSHASLASNCFSVLFLAETGINLAQLLGMRWAAGLAESLRSPDVVRQGYREVKYRAGGREVSFQVTLEFLPKLRTYLKLREYILQGQELAPLFVTLNVHKMPAGLSEQFIAHLYRRLENHGLVLRRVSASQWRAGKQDWVVRHHGPVVAAKVMGHTLETAIKAYSNGTQATHRAEMSSYLVSVENTILRDGEELQGAIQSAVGVCAKFQHPKPIVSGHPVKPDCRSTEGCLFCDKYRIHADAIDICKLVSCRYCIRITSNRVFSVDEYDGSFGAVLRRIEFLLDELRKRDGSLVAQIEKDVEVNGNLDAFWASKLEQLFELGLA